MAKTSTMLRGIVRGKTIELEGESGFDDGQEVSVVISISRREKLPPGEGIRRSAGAWAEDAEELDKYMEWSRQQRKVDRPEIEP